MERDSFVDLEKVRLEMLQEKIELGIQEFKENPKKQWTTVSFAKPLLETQLTLIKRDKQADLFKDLLEKIQDHFDNADLNDAEFAEEVHQVLQIFNELK